MKIVEAVHAGGCRFKSGRARKAQTIRKGGFVLYTLFMSNNYRGFSLALFLIVVTLIGVMYWYVNKLEPQTDVLEETRQELKKPSVSAVERARFYLNTPQPFDNQIPGYDIDRDPFVRDMLYPDGGGTENDMSMNEVSLHASVNDCWIVLDNGIHDITGLLKYRDEHGAIETLANLCGQDITATVNASPVEPGSINTARVRYALSLLFVGFVIR